MIKTKYLYADFAITSKKAKPKIKIIISILLFSCFFLVFGDVTWENTTKLVNINPDPNGEPWIVGGYQEPTETNFFTQEEKEKILNKQKKKPLPYKVNNTFTEYARPVFNQVGGSCGSAARISYQFAYEVNSFYRRDGKKPENIYPSHFTWMLTSQGSSKQQMAIHNGIPNSILYGGDTYSKIYGTRSQNGFSTSDYGWMQGYDKWYSAMCNRIEKTKNLRLSRSEDLQILKGWLHNHNGDENFPTGGWAGLGCASGGHKRRNIPAGQYEAGKNYVYQWGSRIDHATTWTGYDDSVSFDLNQDGKTSEKERGALIMLNSWGSNYANKGIVYVPYALIGKLATTELYYLRKNYKPQRVMKIKMNYSQRSLIQVNVGISSNVNATQPDKTLSCHHFNYGGRGKVHMLGKWADGKMHDEPMEFGYDVTDLTDGYDTKKPLKYFLVIKSKSSASGSGSIEKMSIMNYINTANGQETVSQQTNVNVKGGGSQTLVGVAVPGDVLPIHNQNSIKFNNTKNLYYRKSDQNLVLTYNVVNTIQQQISISIFNAQGKLIKQNKNIPNNKGINKTLVNVSDIAKGIYYCRVSGTHTNIFSKFLIQ